MLYIIVFGAVVFILVLWIIFTYNRLIRLQSHMHEAWSGIDIQLKRRYDLIPNLIDIVKGYNLHEKSVIEQIVQMRALSMGATQIHDKATAEIGLTQSLKTLFALAEQYPNLKANENFLTLQTQLSNIEEDLQLARRYYNATTRDYNIAIVQFPATLIAQKAHFTTAQYFEISNSKEREVPHTKF